MSKVTPAADLSEDLLDLAEFEFHAAQEGCVDCDEYHALWGYGRLAGITNVGLETERDILESLIARSTPEHCRFLIAGTADAGLLALTAQATHGRATFITVTDRCPTPLAVCRRFAQSRHLDVRTIHADLTQGRLAGQYDVAFAHNVLMVQPSAARIDFLRNLHDSLTGEGVLILVSRERSMIRANDELPADYATRILDALGARGIGLPEDAASFRRRLEAYAETRRSWWKSVLRREDVESALVSAGFRVRERIAHDRRNSASAEAKAATLMTNIFIASHNGR